MSQSTDAVLFYGYCWDDEIDMDEFAPLVARNLHGMSEEVLIDEHCSMNCPMPYVYIQQTRVLAWRGRPKEITSLDVSPAWQTLLDGFCAKWDIDVSDMEQRWWLVSYWED